MERIENLWYKDHKYFDYQVEGGKHQDYRVGTHLKIYHQDGSVTTAYQYGDYHYTYSQAELALQRQLDQHLKEYNKERKALLAVFQNMDNDQLKQVISRLNLDLT